MRVSPGEAIAAALARNGLTQAGFAKRMRVSETTVSRWVSGETFPRPKRMKVICDVLGLTPEQIFAGFELDKDPQLTVEGRLFAAVDLARTTIREALDRLDAEVAAAREQQRERRGEKTIDLKQEMAQLREGLGGD